MVSRRAPRAMPLLTRRRVLHGLAALVAAPGCACADATAAPPPLDLPLHLRQVVNHIGISVPDVVKSATFYSRVFDGPKVIGQVKPALRYSISFYPGAMAIGALRSLGAQAPSGTPAGEPSGSHAFIDHFCVAAQPFDLAAWRARLGQEGLRFFARGTFVDIDDINVQLVGGHEGSPRPTGSAGRAGADGGFNPMPPLYDGPPLVKAHGFDQVSLRVSDLEGSAALFQRLFGLVPHRSGSGSVVFGLAGIRLRLDQASAGERPTIASYAVRVAKFDPSRLAEQLQSLGAHVRPSQESTDRAVLHFADPDGIECELVSA
jgi:catechol 2,3-dioxygenase-like lactoylglutathione lyase family enzyme